MLFTYYVAVIYCGGNILLLVWYIFLVGCRLWVERVLEWMNQLIFHKTYLLFMKTLP